MNNPGDSVWVAFHYQAEPGEAIYWLFDNFQIRSYHPVIFEMAGSTVHFDVYAESDPCHFWDSLACYLDTWFEELCSYWDRPGVTPVFPAGKRFSG